MKFLETIYSICQMAFKAYSIFNRFIFHEIDVNFLFFRLNDYRTINSTLASEGKRLSKVMITLQRMICD